MKTVKTTLYDLLQAANDIYDDEIEAMRLALCVLDTHRVRLVDETAEAREVAERPAAAA